MKISAWTPITTVIAIIIGGYAYKISQDPGAMTFASGMTVGVGCVAVGIILGIISQRYGGGRSAPPPVEKPRGDVIDGFQAMPPMLGRGADPGPAFKDTQAIYTLDAQRRR